MVQKVIFIMHSFFFRRRGLLNVIADGVCKGLFVKKQKIDAFL